MIFQSKLLALVNEALNQNAKLRKGGLQATYFCPFCNHYKRKLELNLTYGQWHCWVCHSKGAYVGSLFTKVKASASLRDRLYDLTKDGRLVRKLKKDTETVEIVLPNEFISLSIPSLTKEYKRSIKYLESRGVMFDDIYRYNIGYCTSGEYKDCIIVPSYDMDGNLNYFSARYMYPHAWLKYKNAPYSKNIIGFESFINFSEAVTLVEGAFDAISVRINAVPLFGTSLSTKLKELLILNKTPRVNLILDNDAMKATLNAVQELWKWGINIYVVTLPKKDPSVIGFSEMHELIKTSHKFQFEDLAYYKLIT